MINNKKPYKQTDSQYYMHGIHTIMSAIQNKNRKIRKIFCTQKHLNTIKSKTENIEIEIVENDFISKKIGKEQAHQGIIALVDTIFKTGLEQLDFYKNKDRVVILDQISDPQNIGSIIRSAAAFGFDKIILLKDNSPNENASIAKSSSGCLELVQITKVTNLQNTIKILKDKGFWIIGLDALGNQNLNNITNIDKIAVIIGSEGKGMRRLTLDSCDFHIKIPISHDVESLNASNAASIIFYLLHNLN